ncbi:MAG: alpha-L-rhamnosidase C-terminal domain-containing protein, partial [Flavobacteriaceae bacterium]
CGLYPLEPAWKSFMVKPNLGGLEYAETGNQTIAGKVNVKVSKTRSGLEMELTVPLGSEAVVYIPVIEKKVTVNGKKVSSKEVKDGHQLYRLKGGQYILKAKRQKIN